MWNTIWQSRLVHDDTIVYSNCSSVKEEEIEEIACNLNDK